MRAHSHIQCLAIPTMYFESSGSSYVLSISSITDILAKDYSNASQSLPFSSTSFSIIGYTEMNPIVDNPIIILRYFLRRKKSDKAVLPSIT